MPETQTTKTVLAGHTSPDTAYLVNDYPYGFTLRCSIRYWLEEHGKRGTRFCSQTTNPKRAELHWNTPKKSTYVHICAVMLLAENGHITWTGLSEYDSLPQVKEWADRYRDGLTGTMRQRLGAWISAKEAFEAKRESEQAKGNPDWPFKPITVKHSEPIPLSSLITKSPDTRTVDEACFDDKLASDGKESFEIDE